MRRDFFVYGEQGHEIHPLIDVVTSAFMEMLAERRSRCTDRTKAQAAT
jgi:hypothetical protein